MEKESWIPIYATLPSAPPISCRLQEATPDTGGSMQYLGQLQTSIRPKVILYKSGDDLPAP